MSDSPTYAFEDDKVLAFHGNRVVASGTDFEKVAETAVEYFDALRSEHAKKTAETERHKATHVVTPNGAKGTILGRTASLFADNITVRFENGEIRHFDTFVGDGLKFSKEAADTPKSPVEYFQRQLDETYTPSRDGLLARLNTLSTLSKSAASLVGQGVSYADGQELHKIVLTAEAEAKEVTEALDHLNAADAEAMVAPKQAYTAVEQVSMGHTSDWLEVVANEMVAESEGQDFDKLLANGPSEFVSNLDMGTLANTGVVAEMSRNAITSSTAGFQGEAVEEYRDQFVANAELARRRELSYRKDASSKEATQKEASIADTPDEALFL